MSNEHSDCPGGAPVAMDFSTFVVSLATSALVGLGLAPDPDTQKHSVDLALAKQNIDILCMLREKTRGNLAAEEQKLLDTLLYDLRMAFVRATAG